jgi:hypothetical protein
VKKNPSKESNNDTFMRLTRIHRQCLSRQAWCSTSSNILLTSRRKKSNRVIIFSFTNNFSIFQFRKFPWVPQAEHKQYEHLRATVKKETAIVYQEGFNLANFFNFDLVPDLFCLFISWSWSLMTLQGPDSKDLKTPL